MMPDALRRWLRALRPRRAELHRELHLSRAQRELASARLREVQARLDRLQTTIDAQTERRRAQRKELS